MSISIGSTYRVESQRAVVDRAVRRTLQLGVRVAGIVAAAFAWEILTLEAVLRLARR